MLHSPTSPARRSWACGVVAVLACGCGESITPLDGPVTIHSITPSRGSITGGTAVTITGEGFRDLTEVTAGGAPLAWFAIRGTTEITGLLPAVADTGTVDIVIRSRTQGPVTCVGCFQYYEPALVVTSVDPDTGGLTGGLPVTISGTGFVNVTNVTVGGAPLGGLVVVSPTEIRGTTPGQSAPGALEVVVTSGDAGARSCAGCFTYLLDVAERPVTAGQYHSCALSNSGAGYCWGRNNYGELGDGTTTARSSPVAVVGALRFVSITAADHHTCGLTGNGTAYCWGRNDVGHLGDGSGISSAVPVPVAGGLLFSVLSGGGDKTCGVTRTGMAYCWGWNGYGQLGRGPGPSSYVPVSVAGGLRFGRIAAGKQHTCALTLLGHAYCWGQNRSGQIGDGSDLDPWVDAGVGWPTAVVGNLEFRAIAAGGAHSCGLIPSGRAYCWGNNNEGQLGALVGLETSVPVAVRGEFTFDAIDTRYHHNCGVVQSGAAFCWGGNYSGQLGDSSTANRDEPTAVFGALTLVALATGEQHSCGVTALRTAYCWGDNAYGQLGDGTLAGSLVPVSVLPF